VAQNIQYEVVNDLKRFIREFFDLRGALKSVVSRYFETICQNFDSKLFKSLTGC